MRSLHEDHDHRTPGPMATESRRAALPSQGRKLGGTARAQLIRSIAGCPQGYPSATCHVRRPASGNPNISPPGRPGAGARHAQCEVGTQCCEGVDEDNLEQRCQHSDRSKAVCGVLVDRPLNRVQPLVDRELTGATSGAVGSLLEPLDPFGELHVCRSMPFQKSTTRVQLSVQIDINANGVEEISVGVIGNILVVWHTLLRYVGCRTGRSELAPAA